MDTVLDYNLRACDWLLPAVDLRALYETLSSTIEQGERTGPYNLGAFITLFNHTVHQTRAAHDRKYAEIDHREREIYRSRGGTFDDLRHADAHELHMLQHTFTELRRELGRLQELDCLNESALHDIYLRLRSHIHLPTVPGATDFEAWKSSNTARRLSYWERLDGLCRAIDREAKVADAQTKRRSFRVAKICDEYDLFYPAGAVTAVRKDDDASLCQFLRDDPLGASCHLIYGLFRYSIDCRAPRCARLLSLAPELGLMVDNECFDHLILDVGNKRRQKDMTPRLMAEIEIENDLFSTLLGHLGTEVNQATVLERVDMLKGSALHYIALYGLTGFCREAMASLQLVRNHKLTARHAVLCENYEGYTPLALAVMNGHYEVARIFLESLRNSAQDTCDPENKKLYADLGDLLLVAVQSQFDDMVSLLLEHGASVTRCTAEGYSVLYLAAQLDRLEYVDLLQDSAEFTDLLDAKEPVLGWTPLFIASIEGYTDIVTRLLEQGASRDLKDSRGWTAFEYAAYKGHIEPAREATFPRDPQTTTFLDPSVAAPVPETGNLPDAAPITTIIIHLGSMYAPNTTATQGPTSSLRLDRLDLCTWHGRVYHDTRYTLEVTMGLDQGPLYRLPLPLTPTATATPLRFPVLNTAAECVLNFKIYLRTHTDPEHAGTLLGSAAAVLDGGAEEARFGVKREGLVREMRVPILERKGLGVMGCVTFTYLFARPFGGDAEGFEGAVGAFEKGEGECGGTLVFGHRGLGQNLLKEKYLQLGENTVESLRSASRLGASFVEFDVQLTKDLVPIVFHDFCLSEVGADVPIHDFTLKQFLHASSSQEELGDDRRLKRDRGRSVSGNIDDVASEVREKLKYTLDYTANGFKPNTRGHFIQQPFATLEELFLKIPESTGFDIELKYPRPFEAVRAGVTPVGIEINTFVDTILALVNRHRHNRRILLSSFTPEVCILLSLKQQAYPVFFLSNAGNPPHNDAEKRTRSVEAALAFAKRWQLAGVIVRSDVFVLAPRLIEFVKEMGLRVGSYGPANNVPDNAMLQASHGLDFIIVDRVQLIAKTLAMPGEN